MGAKPYSLIAYTIAIALFRNFRPGGQYQVTPTNGDVYSTKQTDIIGNNTGFFLCVGFAGQNEATTK